MGDIGFGEIEFGETGGRAFRIEDVKLECRRIEERGQRVVGERGAAFSEQCSCGLDRHVRSRAPFGP